MSDLPIKPKKKAGAPFKYGEKTKHFAIKVPESEYEYIEIMVKSYLKKCEIPKDK